MANNKLAALQWKLFSGVWGKRLVIGVIVLLCLLIALVVYQIILQLFFAKSTNLAQRQQQGQQEVQVADVPLSKLPEWHLMGRAPQQQTNGKNVPKTTLRFTLQGISKANQAEFSQAIIAKSGAKGQVYAVGDNVDSGIRVHEILADSVVLDRNGVLEKLELPKKELEFAPPAKGLETKNSP